MSNGPAITTKKDRTKEANEVVKQLDSNWLKSSFILSDKDTVNGGEYAEYLRKNRYHSTADMKFTCTSPGMNIAVNPKPQFTRYCDPRRKGKLKNRPDVTVSTTGYEFGLGQGPFYSEAFDDNTQRVFFRFGTASYTPLLLWISRSFDVDKAILHNRGVITSVFLEGVGVVAGLFAFAAAPLLALGMFALGVIVQNTRFYSVKDTMYTYWATVENILNAIVARRTMVPHVLPDWSYKLDSKMNQEQRVSSEFVEGLNALIPDVINKETGRISVFALALRSQVAFNRMLRADMEANQTRKLSEDFTGYPLSDKTSHDTYFTNKKGTPSLFTETFFRKAYDLLIKDNPDEQISDNNPDGKSQSTTIPFNPIYTDANGNPVTISSDPNDPSYNSDSALMANAVKKKSTYDKYKEYVLSELSEGGAFAVFNVDSTGSVGESFSNSHTTNPLEATFNAISSKARNLGNLLSSATDIPIIGDFMSLAADAGATILSKSTFGIANPLLALAYGVNVSMPKIWESSSATLPRASYKMKLISPYGNAYSHLFNIYLPLSMILAGSLPRSTGNSSYASPFFCQSFDRGRANIQLGMIDNVSITRGTSNLPFSRNGHANAIDVDFSVANMDEIVSVDVSSNGVISKGLAALSPNFSDSPFTAYINTITGVDVYTQVYRLPMLRLKIAERTMAIKSIINPDPAAMAAFTVNKMPFEGLSKLILGNNAASLDDLVNR